MRATTLFLYRRIVQCYDGGRREPKTVAQKLNVTVHVVYKALQRMMIVPRETIPPTKNRRNGNR